MLTDFRVALAIQEWRRRRAIKRANAILAPPPKPQKVHYLRRWQ